MYFRAGVVMIVFDKRKRVYICIIILMITVALGAIIEHFEGETFTEEIISEANIEPGVSPGGINTDGKVNINTANKEELAVLSGIGDKLAERIIDYRAENGTFSQIEGIMLVPGIGEALFENIKDGICIE